MGFKEAEYERFRREACYPDDTECASHQGFEAGLLRAARRASAMAGAILGKYGAGAARYAMSSEDRRAYRVLLRLAAKLREEAEE